MKDITGEEFNTINQAEHYKQIYKELKLILDSAYDEIVIADGDGVILRVSKSCEKLFGIPEKDMIGKNARELEQKGVLSKSTAVYVVKHKKKVTLVQTTRAGRRLMVTGIPMFDDSGKLIRIISISKDITEIENLKKQLAETEEMLEWYRKEIFTEHTKDNDIVIGNSSSIKQIMKLIHQIASVDVIVLITGDTGVGKGVIARTIHSISNRRDKPFIQVNCGAIPESLLESELFGYVEGAFTGANRGGKEGLFEAAEDGTLFLDEIGEMPLHLQVKLLHAIEEKAFYKLGSSKPIKFNARIISATNRDLEVLVSKGKFREDLFYRLNVVPVHIPSLRERKEDIPILSHYFLEKFNAKYGVSKKISTEAYNIFITNTWSGNIRELENTIERLVLTTTEDIIRREDVESLIKRSDVIDIADDNIMPLKQAKEIVEKKILTNALKKYKTTRKIAEVLKVDQSTVVKKLNKYDIQA
ncbi:sigma-54 interaction domain-containing protein [Brassicibacter mesophilus]|uniref:sigma-54 interaction domain-containing protein n=1 Tax=Brassicibacter mesophilus TaxID=745119 RepID=UPI003D2521FB